MGSFLNHFLNIFRFHKLKLLAFVFLLFLFTLVIFPYSDLSDWATQQISQATQNQIYVQFEKMHFGIIPQPGLKLSDVYVESSLGPSLKFGSLTVSPSLRGLLTLKPGVTINAREILSGSVDVTTRGGSTAKSGVTQQIIDLDIEEVSLGKAIELAEAPIQLRGNINADSQITLDPEFSDQPEGDININIKKLHLPPSVAQTPFGPLNVPELKVSKVTLKGRLKAGVLHIDNLQLGNSQDELNGSIKGKIGLKFNKRGVQVTPVFGRYDFTTNLKTLPKLEKKAALFLSFLDAYKTPDIGGTRYKLKLSGSRLGPPPNIKLLDN